MINPQELLFNVDEDNNPIEPQSRELSHATGIWHRTAHVWIMNDRQEILCQQRSLLKDTNPGKWEPFFGGHMAPGVAYVDSAAQELHEELGIVATAEDLVFFEIYKNESVTEFQGVYYLRWNGDSASLELEKDEVEQVAWLDLATVKRSVVTANDGSWSYMGYEPTLLPWLELQASTK